MGVYVGTRTASAPANRSARASVLSCMQDPQNMPAPPAVTTAIFMTAFCTDNREKARRRGTFVVLPISASRIGEHGRHLKGRRAVRAPQTFFSPNSTGFSPRLLQTGGVNRLYRNTGGRTLAGHRKRRRHCPPDRHTWLRRFSRMAERQTQPPSLPARVISVHSLGERSGLRGCVASRRHAGDNNSRAARRAR